MSALDFGKTCFLFKFLLCMHNCVGKQLKLFLNFQNIIFDLFLQLKQKQVKLSNSIQKKIFKHGYVAYSKKFFSIFIFIKLNQGIPSFLPKNFVGYFVEQQKTLQLKNLSLIFYQNKIVKLDLHMGNI